MDSTFSSGPSTEGMPTTSFAAALVAAAVGAFVWGALGYFTGYEVGYVAWGLGALVGWAMARFGGRGIASAITAAVLSVAGIAGGKLLGTHFVVEKSFREGCEATFTPALHAEFVQDAADFAGLGANPADGELRSFMVEHHYSAASSPVEVQEDEVQTFLTTNVPNLRELHANRTSYADWYAAREAESRQAFEAEFSLVQANLEELNGFDLLFVALGVTTAFGIVRRYGTQGPGSTGTGTPATSTGKQEVRKAA